MTDSDPTGVCSETFTVTIHRHQGLPLNQDQMHTAVVLGLGHMEALDRLGGVKLSGQVTVEQTDGRDPFLAASGADPQETDTERLKAEHELQERLTSPARLLHSTGGR